jgi:Family of unknown function (DUF5989)
MKRFWQGIRTRFATATELVLGFWDGPYWWLVPVVLMLLMASIVFVALQAAPMIAPFVYAIF